MAYRAPGVYVKDVYKEPERAPKSVYFWPAIIAPVRNVVENFELEDVTIPANPTTSTVVKLANQKKLKLSIFDEIVADSLKVYLVPQSGDRSGYFWNSITRRNNARYGLTTPITDRPFVDISADVVKTDISTKWEFTIPASFPNAVATNSPSWWNNSTKKPTQPCSVVVEFETRKVKTKTITVEIVQYARQNGTNSITLSFLLPEEYIPAPPQNNYTIQVYAGNETTPYSATIPNDKIDTLTRQVLATVNVTNPANVVITKVLLTYPVVNPIFNSVVEVSSRSQIEESFGYIHPVNTVAYAAAAALDFGADRVVVGALPYDSWSNIATDFDNVLAQIEQNPSVYAVYVGLDASNSQLLSKLNSWLDKYSSASEASIAPKIAITGYEDYYALGSLTDTNAAVQTLVGRIAGLEQKRLRVVMNPAGVVDWTVGETSKIEIAVPGHLFGAQFVGQVYKMMNADDAKPSDSFTLKQARIFKRLRYPNGFANWFSAQQLNVLAEAGYWILYQKTDVEPVIVRHGLTTAERKKATSEDSVVRTVDYVMLTLRNQLETLVGNVKLNDVNIATVFYPRVSDLLKEMIAQGIIEPNSQIKSIAIDSTEKDKLLITISLAVAFPSNVIELTVEV